MPSLETKIIRSFPIVIKQLYNFDTIELEDLIITDLEVLGGQPVFKGTRVPIETLFDHLEAGLSLEEFLDDFPTVTKEQAVVILEAANKLLTSQNVAKLYRIAA